MGSELAFRAQLAIRDQLELYDYWRDRAGSRSVPARHDIDPAAIRRLLPHICIIDLKCGMHDAVFRLAGTRIRDIYGYEVTGTALREMEWGDRESYWDTVYGRIVEERTAMQGVVDGPMTSREHLVLFWLRLPLSDDGRRVNKILCHDISAAREEGIEGTCDAVPASRIACSA